MTITLVFDLKQLLDNSRVGTEATLQLQAQWDAAVTLPESDRVKAFAKITAKRDALRETLLHRTKPLLNTLAIEKKANLVLEKSAVLWSQAEDITSILIAQVDALGPLKSIDTK